MSVDVIRKTGLKITNEIILVRDVEVLKDAKNQIVNALCPECLKEISISTE